MPRTEPNSLPPAFSEWEEWRVTYADCVTEFKESKRTISDEVRLKIRLQRLGYVGVRLDDETRYVKEGDACTTVTGIRD